MGFFITEPNTGDYLIQLKKNRDRSTDEVTADIRKQIESTQPALRVDFGQVIGDMLGDLMTSVQPIEIKIYGDNLQRLHDLSQQAADIVGKVEGAADVVFNFQFSISNSPTQSATSAASYPCFNRYAANFFLSCGDSRTSSP